MQSKHGSLEGAILSTLWNLEKDGVFTNTVKDVFESLAKTEDEKRAYTTIKTVMDRLHEKNILIRYKQGKKFYYRTVYSNNEIVVNSLNEVANRYCNGDISRLAQICNSLLKESHLVGV